MDLGIASVLSAFTAACGSVVVVLMTQRQNKKIGETHATLTTNHHSSPEPTVLDRLSTIESEVNGLKTDMTHVKEKLNEQPSD